MSDGGGGEHRSWERRRELLGAVASVVLLLLALVLAIAGGGEDAAYSSASAARIVDEGDVEDLEATLDHPVYWAGPREGEDLELSVEADGSVYLRYLPVGTEAGDPRQDFLTVGTYPVADAQAALRRTAAAAGTRVVRLPDGSVVLANPASAGSVYLAYPDSDLEIEVYDPRPGRAMELVRSGATEPVGG